jgi:UDP-N-acetylglucosamine 4,6-dehydratase
MVPEDDAHHTLEYEDHFAILPTFHDWSTTAYIAENGGQLCSDGFRYSSDTNTRWLTVEQLRAMAGLTEKDDGGTGD